LSRPAAVSDKKRRTEATRGKRVISSSQRSLADLPQWYAGKKDGVNQRTTRIQKEKICVALFSLGENAMRISECAATSESG
jgi:hypothetical protein